MPIIKKFIKNFIKKPQELKIDITIDEFFNLEKKFNDIFWKLKNKLILKYPQYYTKFKIIRKINDQLLKQMKSPIVNFNLQYKYDENRWYLLKYCSKIDIIIMNLLYSKTNSQFELIDIKYIEDISDSDIDNIEYIKDIYYFPNFNFMFNNNNPKNIWIYKIKKLYYDKNDITKIITLPDELKPFSFKTGPKNTIETFYGANNSNYDKLLFTEESLYSVSGVNGAKKLYEIIYKYIGNTKNLTITDGTSNIGSDSIYLSHFFKYINSIEIDKKTFEVCKNNINVLGIKNINLINGDTTIELNKIGYTDVIFIDAPWGGTSYKKYEKIKLYMSGKEISQVYNENKHNTKLFVLKVPCNYDIQYFTTIVPNNVDIHEYVKFGRCYYKFLVMINKN